MFVGRREIPISEEMHNIYIDILELKLFWLHLNKTCSKVNLLVISS